MTDTIIPSDSRHQHEHKNDAIHYMINRVNTYQLNNSNKEQEYNIIKKILYNNKYDPIILNNLSKTKRIAQQEKNNINKWAKFTYVHKETKFITKLFKNFAIKISYTTNKKISRILNPKSTHTKTCIQFEKSGVYRLKCPDCNRKYVGQTGRSFPIRFQEHYRDFKYNNNKSKFATHLIENHHSIRHIDDIMENLHITYEGRSMDTIDKCYIYKETKNSNQINDKNTINLNKIYDVVIHGETDRART